MLYTNLVFQSVMHKFFIIIIIIIIVIIAIGKYGSTSYIGMTWKKNGGQQKV